MRPELRTKLGQRLFQIEDDALEHEGRITDAKLWVTEHTQSLACQVLGHKPVQDQCCIPEHDYCVWCHARTPNQAPRRT